MDFPTDIPRRPPQKPSVANLVGTLIGQAVGDYLLRPWLLMVAWGALAGTEGWRTIGFGTAILANILIGFFHTTPLPKALRDLQR